ncbi:MAG TPA: hypothetical protein VH325_16095 [Bryobacteraceae bacterium]|jgi:hypothetical protein|nr:hypothetical protein [Bryobacteraceae bacterium]
MAERWLGPGLPGGGGAGSRFFDILCNGIALDRDFDLFKRAGPNRAFVYTIHGVKTNHQDEVVISLVPSKNFPLVNAIEVLDESRPRTAFRNGADSANNRRRSSRAARC